MASYNSTVAALQADPVIGNRADALNVSANVQFVTCSYTMAGTEAAGEFLTLVTLPMRARIDPTLSTVTSEGIATTATLDIGDDDVLGVGAAADEDRYADGLDVAAAGIDLFSANACAARLTPYTLGSQAAIKCLFKTLVTPVADKKLTFRIAYQVIA